MKKRKDLICYGASQSIKEYFSIENVHFVHYIQIDELKERMNVIQKKFNKYKGTDTAYHCIIKRLKSSWFLNNLRYSVLYKIRIRKTHNTAFNKDACVHHEFWRVLWNPCNESICFLLLARRVVKRRHTQILHILPVFRPIRIAFVQKLVYSELSINMSGIHNFCHCL